MQALTTAPTHTSWSGTRHARAHHGARCPPSQIRYERTLPIHLTTCSERLRLWYTSVLRPRRVGLTLVLADVYKATWDDELHPTETERKVMSPADEP